MAQLLNGNEVVIPTEADSMQAKEPGQSLAEYLTGAGGLCSEVQLRSLSQDLDMGC